MPPPAAILLNTLQLPSKPTTKQASRVEGAAGNTAVPTLRLLGPRRPEGTVSTTVVPKLRPLGPRVEGTVGTVAASNSRPLAPRVEGTAVKGTAGTDLVPVQPAKRTRKNRAEQGSQSIVSLPSLHAGSQSVVPAQSVTSGSQPPT